MPEELPTLSRKQAKKVISNVLGFFFGVLISSSFFGVLLVFVGMVFSSPFYVGGV
ncbi:hypothetical protein [Marinomonas pontica]|uniref:hypothetical protein n=1 Tax=Marinomonas pontica TaxID=264739 RepID=UPI0030C6B436